MLVRKVRQPIDLPKREAIAAIAPMLASDDIGSIHPLFTLLANVSQSLLAEQMDLFGLTKARQQTATLLAHAESFERSR
jgi:hypothetical protein